MRRIARIPKLEGKTNHIVRNFLSVTTNVTKKIDDKRCKRYGHIKRMENDTCLKKKIENNSNREDEFYQSE